MFLTKDQIKNHLDCEYRVIKVFGGDARIKSLDLAQLLKLGDIVAQPASNNRTLAITMLCCSCIVDENNEPIFDESDSKMLMRKSEKSLSLIVKTVMDMSQFNSDKHEDAKKN